MLRIALIMLFLSSRLLAQDMFPPRPYGGEQALRDLQEKELVYPRKALRDSVEGTVNLLFLVDRNGITDGAQVWQSLSPECDREAIRLFKKVLWHPARVGSMAMASEHYMRVEFRLGKYRRTVMQRGYDTLPALVVPVDATEKVWRLGGSDTLARPLVPKGEVDLNSYLQRKATYPADAFNQNMEGPVELEFVVEQHGGVSNIRAVRWLGGGCYEEAVKLCKTIRWLPGVKNGKAVRSFARATLNFELPQGPSLEH